MSKKRMKYDRAFREGAVRIVNETNKPIAAVARDLVGVMPPLGATKAHRGQAPSARRG